LSTEKSVTEAKLGVKWHTMDDIKKVIRDLLRHKGIVRKVAADLRMDHGNLPSALRKDANPGLSGA
jgi:hypothetical protein